MWRVLAQGEPEQELESNSQDEHRLQGHKFSRLLLLLVFLLVLITVAQVLPVLLLKEACEYLRNHSFLIFVGGSIFFSFDLILTFFNSHINMLMRMVMMVIMFEGMMLMCAVWSCFADLRNVGLAAGLTNIFCCLIIALAFYCEDLTNNVMSFLLMKLFLEINCLTLIVVFYFSYSWYVFIAICCVILMNLLSFTFYKIQLIFFKKYETVKFGDYMFAAFIIYIDFFICYIFLVPLFGNFKMAMTYY